MKKINIILIIILTALLGSSCEKQLDLVPQNEIGDKVAFEEVADLVSGQIGLYASIPTLANVQLSSRASDDLRLIATNTGQGVAIHNWTYVATDDDIDALWDGNYKAIDLANRILEAANKLEEGATSEELKTISNVKGHCLFVRAHCHFELIRAFAPVYSDDAIGVPYMTQYAVTGSPARNISKDVYDNLLLDLSNSATYLKDYKVREFANIDAVNALKARVLLWRGKYDEAITTAKSLISTSGLTLAGITDVASLWNDEIAPSKEVILRLIKDANQTELGSIFNRTGNEDIFFQPSEDLVSKYSSTDSRLNVYFSTSGSNIIVNKHIGKSSGTKNIVDIKLYRLSEMYFVIAEAYALKGDVVESANYAYEIMSRRDASAVKPIYATKDEAIAGVLLEKRKEMAYEGFRFYDLKRYNKGITRTGNDAILAKGITLPAGDFRFVFPIPQGEMFANENMVQNSGY